MRCLLWMLLALWFSLLWKMLCWCGMWLNQDASLPASGAGSSLLIGYRVSFGVVHWRISAFTEVLIRPVFFSLEVRGHKRGCQAQTSLVSKYQSLGNTPSDLIWSKVLASPKIQVAAILIALTCLEYKTYVNELVVCLACGCRTRFSLFLLGHGKVSYFMWHRNVSHTNLERHFQTWGNFLII